MNKTGRASDSQTASELSLHNAVFLAPPTHVATVVDMALEAREAKSVSTSAEQQFEAAVKASGISIPKFEKRPHRAPVSLLFTPVCDQMILSDQLAGSVFRIWAESQADLRDSVEDYAESNGLPLEGPDYKNRRFRDWMPLKTWNSAIGGVMGDHERPYHPHDVSLMLSMVTGQLPGLVKQATGVYDATGDDLPFDGWLEDLKTSLSSPAGPVAAARFINTASGLVEGALLQEERIEDLIDRSRDIRGVYMQELVFLGRELPAELPDPRRALAGQPEGLDDALNVIEQLSDALEEFRASRQVDHATWDLRQKGMKREAEAASNVHSLIEQLHDVLPEPAEEPEPDSEPVPLTDDPVADSDSLRVKVQHLEAENAALRKKSFNDDRFIASLRDSNKGKTRRSEPSTLESVREAVERAREQFVPQQLLIHLNNTSDPYTNFQRPEEVFQVLSWLATTYREGRVNGGMDDPEHSLKTACSGWKYASDNSEMAMSQYPDAYSTTTPDGISYPLAHHLKKGVDNDERHTIRIAFNWDDEQEMVVVGYIGKHQPGNY